MSGRSGLNFGKEEDLERDLICPALGGFPLIDAGCVKYVEGPLNLPLFGCRKHLVKG
jgi:hypothetical protein